MSIRSCQQHVYTYIPCPTTNQPLCVSVAYGRGLFQGVCGGLYCEWLRCGISVSLAALAYREPGSGGDSFHLTKPRCFKIHGSAVHAVQPHVSTNSSDLHTERGLENISVTFWPNIVIVLGTCPLPVALLSSPPPGALNRPCVWHSLAIYLEPTQQW